MPIRCAPPTICVAPSGRGDAGRNEAFIRRLERRHRGRRVDLAALADEIRRRNVRLLQDLRSAHGDRMTAGQVHAIDELNSEATSTTADITTLVRINTRLHEWRSNADALQAGETSQREHVESQRQEHQDEHAEESARLEREIEEINAQIVACERIQEEAEARMEELDVSTDVRDARHKVQHYRVRRRELRQAWRAARGDQERRDEINHLLEELRLTLQHWVDELGRLVQVQHDNRAALREARRTRNQQRAPINRATRQIQRREQQLQRLEARSGMYTVHRADRRAFGGRGQARGARAGFLGRLDPPPSWSSLLVASEGDGAPADEP